MKENELKLIDKLIDTAERIVIVQADNPDADSLGTALALEELLGNLGKKIYLYCGTTIPSYLHYITAWSRVSAELPSQFDASIIVDASTKTLLQHLDTSGRINWLQAKPCAVIDHHESVQNDINFADVSIIDTSYASTGDIVFHIAKKLKWDITPVAAEMIMISILGDTQGLTNNLASSETYRTMAELIETGVDRSKLEERRREAGKMPRTILGYKAELIKRAEFTEDGYVATVIVPQQEIKEFSSLYNPGPLVQTDLLQTEDVRVAIVFKSYDDGRVTASIRCNNSAPIASALAESFGGGGHPFAAGFRIENAGPVNEVRIATVEKANELISSVEGNYEVI